MKPDLKADTVIENWFLIDFTHNGQAMDKRVLWGIVVEDRKGRWAPGDYCCTSLVLNELEDQVFLTTNSIYRAKGPGKRVTEPVEAINALRAGHSPDELRILANLKKQRPDSHGSEG